jgi:hypothetical protein
MVKSEGELKYIFEDGGPGLLGTDLQLKFSY